MESRERQKDEVVRVHAEARLASFGFEQADDIAGNAFNSNRRADGILAPEQGGPDGGADNADRPARPEFTLRKRPTGFEVQVVDPEIFVGRSDNGGPPVLVADDGAHAPLGRGRHRRSVRR